MDFQGFGNPSKEILPIVNQDDTDARRPRFQRIEDLGKDLISSFEIIEKPSALIGIGVRVEDEMFRFLRDPFRLCPENGRR